MRAFDTPYAIDKPDARHFCFENFYIYANDQAEDEYITRNFNVHVYMHTNDQLDILTMITKGA